MPMPKFEVLESHSECLGPDEQGDALMMELYKRMFTIAYGITKNSNDAMDIVQDSWVKILEKLSTLREPDKLYAWVKVIVTHTAFNRMKKEQVRRMPERLAEAAGWYTMPDIEESMLHQAIQDSLMQLDVLTRQLFHYKYVIGLKDREISQLMGIPLGTVKARLFRGRERLRVALVELYIHNN
jgi:RNA polymerase sigma-70 factor, ECF subfamily